MEKTEIKVEFTIYHDLKLNHQEITEIIGCEPTIIWNKGDQIRKDLFRKESAWIYSSEYTKSLYLENLLEPLVQKLEPSAVLNIKKVQWYQNIYRNSYNPLFPPSYRVPSPPKFFIPNSDN